MPFLIYALFRIYHVTVMPCFDKKLEASREDFYSEVRSVCFVSRDHIRGNDWTILTLKYILVTQHQLEEAEHKFFFVDMDPVFM